MYMYGIEYKLFALFFSICMLAQAYVVRIIVGTYIFPAVLFSFAWFIFTFLPLVLLPKVIVNPLSLLYIFVCTIAFTLSGTPFNWNRAFKLNLLKANDLQYLFCSKTIHYLLYISFALSFVFATLTMVSNGFTLQSIFFDLLKTSGEYAALRGHGLIGYGVLGVLSIFFTYMSSILGGFALSSKKTLTERVLFLFFSLSPSLYFMVIQSSKIVSLTAIVFLLSSMLLVKIYSGKLTFKVRISHILKISILLVIFWALVFISFASRGGYSDFSNMGRALSKLHHAFNSYAFGQLYAFSDYFSYYVGLEAFQRYHDDYYSFGNYTFKAIFDALGGTKTFPPGFYEVSFSYENIFETNIYTAFRGLIADFGGLGTIAFMYIFGFFVHLFYCRLLSLRRSWLACSIFICVLNFFAISYLISIFTSRYIFLIGLVLFFILRINSMISEKPNKIKALIAED